MTQESMSQESTRRDFATSDQYPFDAAGEQPFEVADTDGCALITPDGRRILDAAGGAVVVNIGHGRKEVAQAYADAAARTSYVVPPFATPARLRLTDRLRERWLPEGVSRIGFASGGSEAMDTAMRVARQHHLSAGRPERWRIIGRDLSYHGTTLATLSTGGHLKRRSGFEPLLLDNLAEIPKAPSHYCLRCPLGKSYPEVQRRLRRRSRGAVPNGSIRTRLPPSWWSRSSARTPAPWYLLTSTCHEWRRSAASMECS